ncbi:MAG: HEPN domain-containing protein [Flavobacteriaceae bacterium]|nr:HEPN domain-containing protein [Flavobacteriaceae bacterium]
MFQKYYICYPEKQINPKLSFLKNKSEFNLDASSLLIENNYYAPSVHCSYYSVFQMLKYRFVLFKEISYKTFTQNSVSDRRTSHKYLIDEFCLHLQNNSKFKLSDFEIRNLKRDIEDLKQFRIESDYENLQISAEASNQALSLSESILKRIKKL